MKKKLVYIVHPIKGDVMDNVERILRIVRDINLNCKNVIPFAPYLADVLALNDDNPEERKRGIRNDKYILASGIVDEIWVYGDRVTQGMSDEIKLAFKLDIPIVTVSRAISGAVINQLPI